MLPLLAPLYWLIGAVLIAAAWRVARDRAHPRRISSAVFWGLLALIFVAGDWLPSVFVGTAVLALALIAGLGGVARGTRSGLSANALQVELARLGNRLFRPALLIPALTVVCVLVLRYARIDGKPLLEGNEATLYALALACVVAFAYALITTRAKPTQGLMEAGSLVDAIGWAIVLPLVLATLGAVFAKAGVGELVAAGVNAVVPTQSKLACVVAYAVGMALFTMVMGNAFAAFPVMTAGIGLPLLVNQHGAEAASLAAIGMLSGYCGTLMTPMAANFNIVPAALLELNDKHAVIRAQVMTALPLLAANIVLMYFIVFRGA
jgi:uncharacterized membrane protein